MLPLLIDAVVRLEASADEAARDLRALEPELSLHGVRGVLLEQVRPGLEQTRRALERATDRLYVGGLLARVAPAELAGLDLLLEDGRVSGVCFELAQVARSDGTPHAELLDGLRWLALRRLSLTLELAPDELERAARFALASPGLAIALDPWRSARMHGPQPQLAGLRRLARAPRVVCTLAGVLRGACEAQALRAERFGLALEAFGPQRLLFASGWPPLEGQAYPLQRAQDLLANLEPEQARAVLGVNAARFYAIPG